MVKKKHSNETNVVFVLLLKQMKMIITAVMSASDF